MLWFDRTNPQIVLYQRIDGSEAEILFRSQSSVANTPFRVFATAPVLPPASWSVGSVCSALPPYGGRFPIPAPKPYVHVSVYTACH